jgi:F-type H+-transporting ATPase subunit b
MNSLILAGGILEDLGVNPRVLGVQIIIFIVTFIVLRRLLFERMMRFMTSREEEVEKALAAIRADRAELERLTAGYEAHIARIEKDAYARLQAALKEALEERARIAAEAQQQASVQVKSALADIGREKREGLAALRKEVQGLTRQAVERVVGVTLDATTLDESIRRALAGREP